MKLEGYAGWVEFDGTTVTIGKKFRGQTTVPVAAVQAVSIVPAGIGMTGIRFAVAGGSAAGAVQAVGKHKDLATDPYALTFRSKHKRDFEALAAEVNGARLAPAPLAPAAKDSVGPPPGWYAHSGVQRWWDGSEWTEHTQP